ncbi:MAG: TonB C-terminal domain-containing protein [Candidatus Melainabacteria bacterium]|nr:TonB C-terminal domain-containing protein [Candidatus Melainabacteria bacterium]
MNDRLTKGIRFAATALVVAGGLVSFPFTFGDSENGIGSQSSPNAAYAQAKKKAPAKAGAPQRQAGPNLNNAEINSYLTRMREKLDQSWELPDGKNKVTITATVNADGSTADSSASSAPANAQAEQAANEAFAKVQPLEAMPGSAGARVKLSVTFDSFADPHGDTSRNISTRMDPIMTPKAEDSEPAK